MKPAFIFVIANLLVAANLWAVACSENSIRAETPVVHSVSLLVTNLSVVEGRTETTVQAFVRDKNGILLLGVPLKWSHACDAPGYSRDGNVTVTTSGDIAKIRGIVPHVTCVISVEANGVTADLNVRL